MLEYRQNYKVLNMSATEGAKLKTSLGEYPPQLKWMLKRALEDPEGFWGEVADGLYWFVLV